MQPQPPLLKYFLAFLCHDIAGNMNFGGITINSCSGHYYNGYPDTNCQGKIFLIFLFAFFMFLKFINDLLICLCISWDKTVFLVNVGGTSLPWIHLGKVAIYLRKGILCIRKSGTVSGHIHMLVCLRVIWSYFPSPLLYHQLMLYIISFSFLPLPPFVPFLSPSCFL